MGNCLKKTGKDQETETDPEEDGEKENEEPISKPDTEEVPETVWASTPIQTLNQQEDTTAASAPGLSPSNVGALLNAFVQKSNTQAGGNGPASRFRVAERCANAAPVSLGRFQSARGYNSTACPVAINKYGVGPGYNYSTGWGTTPLPASNCQDPCPTVKRCPSTNQYQSINAYINCYNSCKSTMNNAIVPTQNIDVCRSPSVGVTCNDRLRNGCAPCCEKPRSELDCYSGKMRAEPTCCASAKPSVAPSSCATPRPCASNAYGFQRIYQPALTQMTGAGRFAPAFTTLAGQQAMFNQPVVNPNQSMFNQPVIGSAVASQLIGRFNPNQPIVQSFKNITKVKSAKSGTSMLSMGSSAKGSSAMGSSAQGSSAKGLSVMGSSIMGSSTKGSSKGSSKKPGVTKPNYIMPKASGNRLAPPGGGGEPKKGGSGTSVSILSNLSNKSGKGKKGKGKGKKKGKGKGKGKKK